MIARYNVRNSRAKINRSDGAQLVNCLELISVEVTKITRSSSSEEKKKNCILKFVEHSVDTASMRHMCTQYAVLHSMGTRSDKLLLLLQINLLYGDDLSFLFSVAFGSHVFLSLNAYTFGVALATFHYDREIVCAKRSIKALKRTH